jgi:hypothetical protein
MIYPGTSTGLTKPDRGNLQSAGTLKVSAATLLGTRPEK